MKHFVFQVFFVFATLIFFSCQQTKTNMPSQSNYSWLDSSENGTDTFYEKILLDTQLVAVCVLRAKLDEHRKPFDDKLKAPLTLAVIPHNQNQPIYLKSFENAPDDYPFTSYQLFKVAGPSATQTGPLFFSKELGYGGSGSNYQLYWFSSKANEVKLQEIYKGAGELTYPYFSKDGNSILVLEGIWNMDKNEAHFDSHIMKITKIDLGKDQFNSQLLGQTKYKYAVPDNDSSALSIIKLIRKQESKLVRVPNF